MSSEGVTHDTTAAKSLPMTKSEDEQKDSGADTADPSSSSPSPLPSTAFPSSPPFFKQKMAGDGSMPPPALSASKMRQRLQDAATIKSETIDSSQTNKKFINTVDPLSSQGKQEKTTMDPTAIKVSGSQMQGLSQPPATTPSSIAHSQLAPPAGQGSQKAPATSQPVGAKQTKRPFVSDEEEDTGSDSPRNPHEDEPHIRIDDFDWLDLQERWHARIDELDRKEQELMREFNAVVNV